MTSPEGEDVKQVGTAGGAWFVTPTAGEGGDPRAGRRRGLRARVGGVHQRVQSARPNNRALDAVLEAAEHDAKTGGGVLAAAVAFRVFLFIVPYAFVLVIGLGFADEAAGQSSGGLAHHVGVGGIMVRAINGGSHLSTGHRLFAVVGGVVALFLASRTLVKVLRIAYALVWQVAIPPAESVNSGALVLIGAVTVALGLGLLVAKARALGLIVAFVAIVLFAMIPTVVWFLASDHLPHPAIPRYALIPGALLVGGGVLVLHLISVYYLPLEISHKSATYGSIATALALLAWAYMVGRLLTGAAVLNAALWHRRQARGGRGLNAGFPP